MELTKTLPERAYEKWTDSERELLRNHYNNHGSVRVIAETLGRTKGAILSQLEHMGLVTAEEVLEGRGVLTPKAEPVPSSYWVGISLPS